MLNEVSLGKQGEGVLEEKGCPSNREQIFNGSS